MEGVHNGDKG
jgi:hypothetical protein